MFLSYNLSRYPLSITVSHSFLLQAQSDLSRLVGEEDARTARAMFCPGSILIFQNKISKAEEQLSRVMVLYKIDGNRIEKIMCQEKLAEARLALGKVAMAEATSRACLSWVLEIHSVEHQYCLRLFVAWARCMRLLPYPALTFAVLRFVLECKVARSVRQSFSGRMD
jgi:hypothetical protein